MISQVCLCLSPRLRETFVLERPRRENPNFQSSWRDYSTTAENKKTYGRFFGTIFFGAFKNLQDAGGQQHAKLKSHQNV